MALYNRGGFALENEARALEASDDYRVLRRLPQPDELWLAPTPFGGPAITIAAIDTETTGLSDRDTLIEIAIVKISLDHHGRVCDIKRPIVQLEDPLVPLSAEIQRVLTNDRAYQLDERNMVVARPLPPAGKRRAGADRALKRLERKVTEMEPPLLHGGIFVPAGRPLSEGLPRERLRVVA